MTKVLFEEGCRLDLLRNYRRVSVRSVVETRAMILRMRAEAMAEPLHHVPGPTG